MITAPFHYECETERWLLKNDKGDTLNAFEVLAFAFDLDSFTLFKHGEALQIRKWMKEKAALMPKTWNFGLLEFKVGFPVAEVNHALHTSGYVKQLIKYLDCPDLCEPQVPKKEDEHPF